MADENVNLFGLVGGRMCTPISAVTLASAATIAPVAGVTLVSGTTAIDTITIPYTGFSGSIVLIPTGIWTLSTAGNVKIAVTAVVSKALWLTYNPLDSKWYPSYLS